MSRFTYLAVETGSGQATANTYCDTSYADSYHSRYGNPEWLDFNEQDQEQALMQAARAMDSQFGASYRGRLKTNTQGLLFPRTPFTDQNGRYVEGIPNELKNAQCEYALLVLNNVDLFVDPNRDESGIKSISSKAAVVGEAITYFAPKGSTTYSKTHNLLRPLLTGSAYQATAVRG